MYTEYVGGLLAHEIAKDFSIQGYKEVITSPTLQAKMYDEALRHLGEPNQAMPFFDNITVFAVRFSAELHELTGGRGDQALSSWNIGVMDYMFTSGDYQTFCVRFRTNAQIIKSCFINSKTEDKQLEQKCMSGMLDSKSFTEFSPAYELSKMKDPKRSIRGDLKIVNEYLKKDKPREDRVGVSLENDYTSPFSSIEKSKPTLAIKWVLLKMHWTFDDDRYMKLARQLQSMLDLTERPPVPLFRHLKIDMPNVPISNAQEKKLPTVEEFNFQQRLDEIKATLSKGEDERADHLVRRDQVWDEYENAYGSYRKSLSANQGTMISNKEQDTRPSVDSFF